MPGPTPSTYSFEQLAAADERLSPGDLIAAAHAQAQQIRERAEEDGRARGLEAAQGEVDELTRGLAAALGDAARALSATRAELVERLTREAAEVALRIGRQVVGDAVAVEPALVVAVARAAIRRLAERHRVTIAVNPAELTRVAAALDSIRSEVGGIEYLDVRAEGAVQRGGALVQTEYGEIDATIETEIANARSLVRSALDGDPALKGDAEPTGAPDATGATGATDAPQGDGV